MDQFHEMVNQLHEYQYPRHEIPFKCDHCDQLAITQQIGYEESELVCGDCSDSKFWQNLLPHPEDQQWIVVKLVEICTRWGPQTLDQFALRLFFQRQASWCSNRLRNLNHQQFKQFIKMVLLESDQIATAPVRWTFNPKTAKRRHKA